MGTLREIQGDIRGTIRHCGGERLLGWFWDNVPLEDHQVFRTEKQPPHPQDGQAEGSFFWNETTASFSDCDFLLQIWVAHKATFFLSLFSALLRLCQSFSYIWGFFLFLLGGRTRGGALSSRVKIRAVGRNAPSDLPTLVPSGGIWPGYHYLCFLLISQRFQSQCGYFLERSSGDNVKKECCSQIAEFYRVSPSRNKGALFDKVALTT